MDEARGRMPAAPHAHLPLTVRTAQGVSPAALLRALAGGEGGDDLQRSLDDALDLGQSFLHQAFDLCKRLGRLHPVLAYPWETLGKHMLYHTSDQGVDLPRFPLDPLARVGPLRLRDPLPIVASDPPERDRRTHHLCGQIRRQTLIPRRHIALLDVGDTPLAIPRGTRLHQPRALLRLSWLSQHCQQIPRPRRAQHGIRHIRQMHPLLGLLIPAAAGGHTMQMGVGLPMTAMRLEDQDGAALEGAATDSAEAIVQALDPTAHARTQ
jgi:hypothetical protein